MTSRIDEIRSIITEKHEVEPAIVGTVPCIVCGYRIPINACQSFDIQRMCRACKQAVMAMRKMMELEKQNENSSCE